MKAEIVTYRCDPDGKPVEVPGSRVSIDLTGHGDHRHGYTPDGRKVTVDIRTGQVTER